MKLKDIVSNRLQEIGMSYYRLSKESGVDLTALYAIKNGVRDEMTLTNTVKVFKALNIDLNELLKIDWKGERND